MFDDNSGKKPPFAPSRIVSLLAILTPEMCAAETEVAILATKVQEQEEEIVSLRERNNSLYSENDEAYRRMRTLEQKVNDLKYNSNVSTVEALKSDLEYYKGRCVSLEQQLQNLHTFFTPQMWKAHMWEVITGEAKNAYNSGNKIQAIKILREASRYANNSGWGLKESKDFVENMKWDNITRGTVNEACTFAKVGHIFTPAEVAEAEDNVGNQKTPGTIGELIKSKLGGNPNAHESVASAE